MGRPGGRALPHHLWPNITPNPHSHCGADLCTRPVQAATPPGGWRRGASPASATTLHAHIFGRTPCGRKVPQGRRAQFMTAQTSTLLRRRQYNPLRGESTGKVYQFDKAYAVAFIHAPGKDYRSKNLKQVSDRICRKRKLRPYHDPHSSWRLNPTTRQYPLGRLPALVEPPEALGRQSAFASRDRFCRSSSSVAPSKRAEKPTPNRKADRHG